MTSTIGHQIHLITGSTQSGKSTLVEKIVQALKKEQLIVRGFLSKGTMTDGVRTSFVLCDLDGSAEIPLASVDPMPGWSRMGRFSFNPDAWVQGEAMIRSALSGNPDLIVIDEVGPLELQGGGWTKVLELLENAPHLEQLWVVREQILTDVMTRWNIPPENTYQLKKSNGEEIIRKFTSTLIKRIGL